MVRQSDPNEKPTIMTDAVLSLEDVETLLIAAKIIRDLSKLPKFASAFPKAILPSLACAIGRLEFMLDQIAKVTVCECKSCKDRRANPTPEPVRPGEVVH